MATSLEEVLDRLASLERRVDILYERLEQPLPGSGIPRRQATSAKLAQTVEVVEKKRDAPRPSLASRVPWTTEDVMKWAGISLVLLSVAFLFKYAVDEGWLTPVVRVILGLLVGLVLLGLGFGLRRKRPGFGLVLQGGGIAAFYITLFAAYQVLDVAPYPIAFGAMIVVTALALVLGLMQHDASLSVFGLIGGLGTPFLLYTPEGSISGLVAYTVVLLAATTAIYLFWGWRSMLYATVIGGWIVFFIGLSSLPSDEALQIPDRVSLQLAAAFGLAAFWAVPVFREWLRSRDPEAWPSPTLTARSDLARLLERLLANAVHQMVIITPIIALTLTAAVWDLDKVYVGILFVSAALLFAVVAWSLHTRSFGDLAYTHAWSALLLATLSLPGLFSGEIAIVAFAGEATAMHFLATRRHDHKLAAFGHALWLVPGFWLLFDLAEPFGGPPAFFNGDTVKTVLVIAFAMTASFSFRAPLVAGIYRGVAHLALLALIHRELVDLPSGQGYITILWTAYAVSLLAGGVLQKVHWLRVGGFATLAIVVGKLFFVDLSNLEAMWRILLFLGIGGVFLLIAYFMPNIWRDDRDATSDLQEEQS